MNHHQNSDLEGFGFEGFDLKLKGLWVAVLVV